MGSDKQRFPGQPGPFRRLSHEVTRATRQLHTILRPPAPVHAPSRLPDQLPPLPYVVLQVDGTPGWPARGTAGVGIVVRTPTGKVLAWHMERVPAKTNQEAEYQALIAGLSFCLQDYSTVSIRCLSDNQSMVGQMIGRAKVRSASLQPFYARAIALAAQFSHVDYVSIPRELNRLADALAWEALAGSQAVARRGSEIVEALVGDTDEPKGWRY